MSTWIITVNQTGTTWCDAIWRASWQGGLALLLVFGICRLITKIPARFQCWLWRLAYLKLLLSFFLAGAIPLAILPEHKLPPRPGLITPVTIANQMPQMNDQSPTPSPVTHPRESNINIPPISPIVHQPVLVVRPPLPRISPLAFMMVLWLIGVLWGVFRLRQAWKHVRRLRNSTRKVIDRNVQQALADVCTAYHLRHFPILQMGEVTTPVLVGGIPAYIILPPEQITKDSTSLRMMLAHEIAHLQRSDLLWRSLGTIAEVLCFFHPAIWLVRREERLAQEMACDALVMQTLQEPVASYAEMLVHCSRLNRQQHLSSLMTAEISEGGYALKRRLLALGKVNFSRRSVIIAGCIVLLCALIGLTPWRLITKGKVTDVTSASVPYNDPLVNIAFTQKQIMPTRGTSLLYDSPYPVISADGSRILLIPNKGWELDGATSIGNQVYMYHRQTGTIENLQIVSRKQGRFNFWTEPNHWNRVSWDGKVTASNTDSEAVLSPDGKISAFYSTATNITPEPMTIAEKGKFHLYISDADTKTIVRRVYVPNIVQQLMSNNQPISKLQFSRDDRYIAFSAQFGKSWWKDAQMNRGGGFVWQEVMVYDRISNELRFANVNESGERVSVPCSSPNISADGHYLLFKASSWLGESGSSDTAEINAWKAQQRLFNDEAQSGYYLYNIQTRKVRRYNQLAAAVATTNTWFYPFSSHDGQFVVTDTRDNKPVATIREDKDPCEYSVIQLYNTATGKILDVSAGGREIQERIGLPYYSHEYPTISEDGRYISYVTRMSNVKFWDSTITPFDNKWKGIIHLAVAIQVYDRKTEKTSTVLLATDLPQNQATQENLVKPNSDPPISLHTNLLSENGSVTAYEPVLVKVEERNESTAMVTLPFRIKRVIIEDGKGQIVALSPTRSLVDTTYRLFRLKHGESRISILAISALYSFATPGDYTIRVQHLKYQPENSVLLAEDRVTVHVQPFNAIRLQARCDELSRYTRKALTDRDLIMSDLTRALLSVRHDIALPYIEWQACNSDAYEGCSALRLLGTPRALHELNSLAKRHDKVGRAAQSTLAMPMNQIIWGILGDGFP